jgi:hypothetical protein
LRDLLGVADPPGKAFAADSIVNGFDNNAEALWVPPPLADPHVLAEGMAVLRAAHDEVLACADTQRRGAQLGVEQGDGLGRGGVGRLGPLRLDERELAGSLEHEVHLAVALVSVEPQLARDAAL